MADWSTFFYGVVAGSALTILGMSAAVYSAWLAICHSVTQPAPRHHEGPWGG